MAATIIKDPKTGKFMKAPRTRRLGAQFAPHLVVAACIAGTAFAWLLSLALGAGPLVGIMAVAAFGVGVGRLRVLARRGTLTRPVLSYTAACTGVAWIWAALWVAGVLPGAGLSEWMWFLASGYCTGCVLALPWWSAHRIPNPDPNATPEPEPEPEPEVIEGEVIRSELEENWDAFVFPAGKALPGAGLAEIVHSEHITRGRIDLVRGKQTIDTAIAAQKNIAGALGTKAHKIIIEEHPDYDSDAIAQLTIVTGQPIGTVVDYTGSTYDPATGAIGMGPFVDGDGWAQWQLYSKNSMLSGFIAAMSGMGKSRLIDAIAHSAMSSGHTVVWYCDPQGGASSPALAEAADWTARTLDSIRIMLEGLLRVVKFREAYNATFNKAGFTPTRAYPGILVIIDECHMAMADPIIQGIIAQAISICRKVGIGFIFASQQGDLTAFGGAGNGSSERIRNQATRNLVFLKTNTKNAQHLIGGADSVNPNDLPAIPGYAFQPKTINEEGSFGRNAAFRVAHLGDADDAPQGWFQSIPAGVRAVLDEASVKAIDEIDGVDEGIYTNRHETAAADVAAARALVDYYMGSGPRPAALDKAAAAKNSSSASTTGASYGGAVIDIQSWAQAKAEHERESAEAGPDLGEAQRRILDLVRAGTAKKKDLEIETGWSETYVRNRLNELTDLGLIEPVVNENGNRTGFYRLRDQPVLEGQPTR